MDSTADSTADEIFRIVPEKDLPGDQAVVILEIDGQHRWLIREGALMNDIVAEMNHLATHLIRHGLWVPQRGNEQAPPRIRHAS